MACNLCPLGKLAITNCMPNLSSGKTLVVLPHPTSEEDCEGNYRVQTFKLLQEAGIQPKDITLTSAVRCTPGRDGVESESLTACREHLRATINAVRPNCIIAFGDLALRATTKKSGIKQQRGKELQLHKDFGYECKVVATYSVGDVQRIPTYKKTVLADLRLTNRSDDDEPIEFQYWSAS